MLPTELVKLPALMQRTSGSPEVRIGLIDGPVFTQHADLVQGQLMEIGGRNAASCTQTDSGACLHGTFVAGILAARRTSSAPAICPNCTLLIRPIFSEATFGREHMPSATPQELATAIFDCINAGARVINLSLALARPSTRGEKVLDEAFTQALKQGVLIVAAAGNQGTLGGSVITRHPWVIPVVACDLRGRPINESNLGGSIGMRGLSAPGENITSLDSGGQAITLSGTSMAVPFVTGAIALLWSEFPDATVAQIKLAIMRQPQTFRQGSFMQGGFLSTRSYGPRRASIVPPLLDAEAAYQMLSAMSTRRQTA
ncbi:Subtilase family protein [Nitrosospira multiformis ATCC 25196]|uniref:Peptidase S8 and S53, subtilisin, kexin, sedolisin n=1 Tax=Nitrosospira multiformis (strain ATCC 25196 / NCIMB 11849 / C 71) TaxID=323848 RepID=Q2YAS3_NITMU|nr:S8 family serine peptidase [Nitrosospira multiformis]ABB74148.1 Peptidase S8 and S53, subtilisin, kexin, sedolisin [Nitrosospira multiformis ATCC 25196]SEF45859.1 Subtilase family protein [Nitrosospira multiformis ATCC 25196]